MNSLKKLKEIYLKYEEVINYLIFGFLTTIVNIAVYYIFYEIMRMGNISSNIIAWILSVLFAYLTNKIWVFKSYKKTLKKIIIEIFSFFSCRFVTGFLDTILMYITIEILNFEAIKMKILINIIVIILNYISSKYLIFKNKKERD